jgi:CRP/FNR family transcriptional regulator, dissimilatory nitrate respiration regulator
MIGIMSTTLIEVLSGLPGRERPLKARSSLFCVNDPVRQLHIVTQGSVRLSRSLPRGGELTLQRAKAGELLAEGSIFARRYHCDAIAMEDSTLRSIPLRKLHAAIESDVNLNAALLRHLAHELQRARAQSEILALKTIVERVRAWKSLNGGALPPKGQWHTLATHIGVSPEALYRELARMRATRRAL